jgi:hypothetical protein
MSGRFLTGQPFLFRRQLLKKTEKRSIRTKHGPERENRRFIPN